MRCWAVSCRSRWIRRRSESMASTKRRRSALDFSDLTPDELIALASVLRDVGRGCIEFIPRTFLNGYDDADRELIRAIRIPRPLARLTAFHKIAKRRFDDISSVAVGFAIDHDDAGIVTRA